MAKTIQIEYTNPVTGVQSTKQVSIEVERYRKDTEEGATENFFLKATASGSVAICRNIDDLVADLLDGRPSLQRNGVVQSLIDTQFTSGGTALSVTPHADDAGFVANVPCVVLSKYGTVVGWFIPTVAGADFTIPAANEGALDHDCEVGWIVQQAEEFLSPLGENSELGIKAQSEQPAVPTTVAGSGSVGAGITISFTKPADVVIAFYDIYVIKSATEPASIEPNSLASMANRAASAASTGINLTQYFDQSIMELTALDAGTYFVGVVAKDGTGMVEVNESEIAWSAAITIA